MPVQWGPQEFDDMDFDVLMVTYVRDNPDFLNEAIQSVTLNQTIKPAHVVVVVNGPIPPRNEEVLQFWIESLGPDSFILVRLPENYGLGYALNAGLESCNSSWIARMDSDDLSVPDRFRLQTEFLKNHPEIRLLGGAIRTFRGERLSDPLTYPTELEAIRKFICRGSPFAHPSVMIHKEVLIHNPYKSNLFNPKTGSSNEDIELWFRLVRQRLPMANLSEVVLLFRVTDSFYSRRSLTKALDEFKIYLQGIHSIFRLSWRLIFPFARFLMRCMPSGISFWLYRFRNTLYRYSS